MSKVVGKIIPIRDHILITDMEFGSQTTKGGLVLLSDDGKSEGVRHRWGRVWAIGPLQKDVKVGDWILLEHGRWTRGITVEDENGNDIVIRRADNVAILMVSEEKPDERMLRTFGLHSKADHPEFKPESFARM